MRHWGASKEVSWGGAVAQRGPGLLGLHSPLRGQTGMGLVGIFSRIGGILTPLVTLLGEYHTALPMLIYGSLPIGAGLLCALLPEPRGWSLKDAMDDMEQESCPQRGAWSL